jgi:hypothetical protein
MYSLFVFARLITTSVHIRISFSRVDSDPLVLIRYRKELRARSRYAQEARRVITGMGAHIRTKG